MLKRKLKISNHTYIMHRLDIDSEDRQSGTVGDFTIRIPREIKEIDKLTLLSAEVPFTFYVFDGTNNNFTIDQGGAQIFSVGVGNYTATELAAAMETSINLVYSGFTVTYSNITGKIQIADATVFDLSFGDNNLARQIGFDENVSYAGSSSYTSPNVVNTSGEKYIYIKSERLTTGTNNRPYNANRPSDVLVKLPLFPNPFGFLFYLPFMEISMNYPSGKSLDKLDFQLTDKNGKILDLNGEEWSISFLVKEK